VSAPALLEVRSLTVRFGGLTAVADLDLDVPEGSIVGLIGPNGAGKTTAFNVISGLQAPTAGSVRFRARPISGLPPHRVTALGLARTFQNIRLFGTLSVLDNVLVGSHVANPGSLIGTLTGRAAERRAEREAAEHARELLAFVGLDHRGAEPAGTLPFGEQRRLELARALATRPALVLLDEPAAGANPTERAVLMAYIRRIRERGVTVLLIEHDMKIVMGVCERVVVLNFGRRIAVGPPEAVARDTAVVEAYLGADVS
jgi:branched-chain amino acid transport system ATP-binding protein